MTAIRSSHKVIKPWKHSINCEGGHNCGCVLQKESMSAVRSSSFDLPEELEESIYGKPKATVAEKKQRSDLATLQFEETKVADVTVVVETPTLAHALSIFAYHIAVITASRDRGGLYFFGNVSMRWDIQKSINDPKLSEETNRDWDQFFIEDIACGKQAIGNRCAAREEYVKRCVPVLMRIAKGEKV